MTLFLALLGLAAAAVLVIATANRLRPIDYSNIKVRDADHVLSSAGPDLSVLTWNIGYGALGKDADMYVDGGSTLRALSKPQIIAAASAIAETLSQTSADVMCLQEVAQAGFLTRNVDVQRAIDDALPNRQRHFWADINTILLPRGLGMSHGMATYSSNVSDACHVLDLPDAITHLMGILKKPYVGLVNRLPITDTDKTWVIINIHLPVYNTTAAARTAQLKRLFDIAKHEYNKGNYVIIAGDWNTRLSATSFAHTSDPKRASDYTDFPHETLPEGWHIHADLTTPTVRALHTVFVKDQTYTTIFDGFIVSPNVRVSCLQTHDLGFAHSDHQPVEGRFSIVQ